MLKNRFSFPLGQIARYGLVGFLNNSFGYLIYLLLTWLWLDPKVAVTLLYPIGAITGYFGHSKFTFLYSGSYLLGVFRYILAHLVGYGTNISILYNFVDMLGYPHQLIQAIAIFITAGILFLLFRYYVFPHKALA